MIKPTAPAVQILAFLISLCTAVAADLTVKTSELSPPKELAEPVQKALSAKGIQVLDGSKPVYQFWFRPEVPLKTKPASADKALQSVAEITWLGAAVVGEGRRDYKDNEIVPGVYTIRFGLQPQDGDHLGTSEFPYFAVLLPAKSDPDPNAIKTYKALVKTSGKGTATGHPIVLSLRPATPGGPNSPTLTTPAPDHKAIRLSLPAKAPESGESSNLDFELVVEGKFKS